MGLVFPANIPERIVDETRVVIAIERVIAGIEQHLIGLFWLSPLGLHRNHSPQTLNQPAIDFFDDRHCRLYGIINEQKATIFFQAIDTRLKLEQVFWLIGMGNEE